jgi:hypothetical protein
MEQTLEDTLLLDKVLELEKMVEQNKLNIMVLSGRLQELEEAAKRLRYKGGYDI